MSKLKRACKKNLIFSIVNKMTKSIPINKISSNEDDATIQEVLESLDVDIQQYPDDIDMNKEEYEDTPLTSDSSISYNNVGQSLIPPAKGFSISDLSNDITNIITVFVVFILVSKIPLEKFIYKYVSIEHVPMSQTIIKAIFAAIAFFIINRLIKLL
jgi:hypothetical protein